MMVGTLRSTGCDTCRKRKKKCGEERPACRACLAAGWKCPGYSKRWKFVDENNTLSSYYSKKHYIYEEIDVVSSPEESHDLVIAGQIDEKLPRADNGELSIIMPSLSFRHEKYSKTLIYMLKDPGSQGAVPLRSHGSFFQFIPSRLGHNAALDATISCLCNIYTNTLTIQSPISADSVREYSRSAKALRKCLGESVEFVASETICASLILQICELTMDRNTGIWNQLSNGSKLLVQNSGPERFKAPFERAMLESQRAFFIVQDVNAGRRCFLAEPEWRQLFKTPDNSPKTLPSIRLRTQLCDFLVEIPDLISDMADLIAPPTNVLIDPIELAYQQRDVIFRAAILKRDMEAWYAEELQPLRLDSNSVPEQSPVFKRDIPADGIEYPEILHAVVDCVSNSVLLRLDEMLLALLSVSTERYNDLELFIASNSTSKRLKMVRQSYQFVKSRSRVAAKPLEFGLKQLWSTGNHGLQSHRADGDIPGVGHGTDNEAKSATWDHINGKDNNDNGLL